MDYKGQEYTPTEIAKITKLPIGRVFTMIGDGLTVEQIFESYERYYTPASTYLKVYDYDGNKYTLQQLSKKYEISYSTLRSRLKQGLSVKDAIEKQIRGKKKKINLDN